MKKIFIVIAVLAAILIVTNPSIQKFKEFKVVMPAEGEKVLYTRTANYLIFSYYECKIGWYDRFGEYNEKDKKRYVGILMNFLQR